MITLDDIAKVVKDRHEAVTSFTTIVPGGIRWLRHDDIPSSGIYIVFQIKGGPNRLTTGAGYVQIWTVDAAAYMPIGDSSTNAQNVEQVLHAALVTTGANTSLLAVSLRNASEKVLAGRVAGEQARFDEKIREGRDVFVAGLTSELIVQGDRSVA